MDVHLRNDRVAHASRVLVSASRRNNLCFAFHQAVTMIELKGKFAIAGRARQHARRVRYLNYANTRGVQLFAGAALQHSSRIFAI
ncbi:MAG: hypothetical protein DMF24_08625 [Verrucomicrobia bacterium]|nr:MAG: hypothetical protein DMF24_08625 [Verrucomicrobiota bacterium]